MSSPCTTAAQNGTWRFVSICVGLAVLVLLTFAPVFRCEFISFDDPDYVTENWAVRAGISWEGLVWAFSTGHAGNWHPVTWISHMVDCQFFGMNPAAHHGVNLGFHILNTLLLFCLLRRVTGFLWRSALVAVLFGIHPMHVESVAWISERKDLLSTFFGLLAILAYRRATLTSHSSILTSRYYLACLVCFACSLMSKPMLVTLPFVLLLLDFWPLNRWKDRPRRILLEKVPFLLLSLGSCLVTFSVQQKGGAVAALSDLSLSSRIANAVVSYGRYLGKLIWPTELCIYYPPVNWTVPIIVGAVLLLTLLSLGVLKLASTHPYLPVGWFWFIGTLVPVIGLVQVGGQSMADRYSYIPSIGLFIATVWGLGWMVERRSSLKVPASVVAVTAIAVLAVAGFHQSTTWKSSLVLFSHAIRINPENPVAQSSLGEALFFQNKLAEAKACQLRALELAPRLPSGHYHLGLIAMAEGNVKDGIERWLEALKCKPAWPGLKNNLAWTYAASSDATCRRPDEALRLAQEACLSEPWNPSFFDTLGAAYARAGRFPEAISAAKRAISLAEACGRTNTQGFHSRLEIYLQGQPYRDSN